MHLSPAAKASAIRLLERDGDDLPGCNDPVFRHQLERWLLPEESVRVVPGKLLQVQVERELRSAVLHLREDLHQRDGVIVTLDVPPDAYRGAGDVAACNEVTEVAAVVGANPLLVRTHDVAEPVEHRPVAGPRRGEAERDDDGHGQFPEPGDAELRQPQSEEEPPGCG